MGRSTCSPDLGARFCLRYLFPAILSRKTMIGIIYMVAHYKQKSKLMTQGLYRIQIREAKVHKIISNIPQDTAACLSVIIIIRLIMRSHDWSKQLFYTLP